MRESGTVPGKAQPATAVHHPVSGFQPRRSWLTFLIGSPLATAEAEQQAITVVVPQMVTQGLLDNMLQSHTADFLRLALFFTPGVVVTDVLCQFDPSPDPAS